MSKASPKKGVTLNVKRPGVSATEPDDSPVHISSRFKKYEYKDEKTGLTYPAENVSHNHKRTSPSDKGSTIKRRQSVMPVPLNESDRNSKLMENKKLSVNQRLSKANAS